MNIVYVANLRLPTEKAHGLQIMKMCEALSHSGASVELIVPRRRTFIDKDPFDYYAVDREFTISKLPCLDWVGIGFIGFVIEILSFFIVAKWRLPQHDVIIYSREWLASIFFHNVILELHSLPKRFMLWHKLAWHRAGRIVVLTSNLKTELVGAGISKDKILVAPDAVDIKQFNIDISRDNARHHLGLDLNYNIVLYSGHLYNWKGVDTLALAANKLPTNTLVVFVGGTDNDLKNFRQRFGTHTSIMIAGRRDHAEIPIWLKAADILVLPNSGRVKISSSYTSPMKLFEYMASRRPIVAADLPSLREILSEDNALFFTADDHESLAASILHILNNPKLSQHLAARAFSDVQSYTWDKRSDKILAFIR